MPREPEPVPGTTVYESPVCDPRQVDGRENRHPRWAFRRVPTKRKGWRAELVDRSGKYQGTVDPKYAKAIVGEINALLERLEKC
jgi:hypothetical protein